MNQLDMSSLIRSVIAASDVTQIPATATWPLVTVLRDLVPTLDLVVTSSGDAVGAARIDEKSVNAAMRLLHGEGFLFATTRPDWVVDEAAAYTARRAVMRLSPGDAVRIADAGNRLAERLHEWLVAVDVVHRQEMRRAGSEG